MRRHVEIARLQDDQRPDFFNRHALVADDLHAFGRDSIHRSFADVEHDGQLAVGFLRLTLDLGLEKSMLQQIRANPLDRILDQIFVNGSFALERGEFVAAIGGQRVAFEPDRHDGPASLDHIHVRNTAIV